MQIPTTVMVLMAMDKSLKKVSVSLLEVRKFTCIAPLSCCFFEPHVCILFELSIIASERELKVHVVYNAIFVLSDSVGLTGIVSRAYLRVSFQSFDRLNASGVVFSSNEELVNDLEVLVSYKS